MNVNDLPPVLDVPAAAGLLRCTDRHVEELARRGELPGLKVGVSWVFPAGALLRRLDEMALEQAAARRKPRKLAGTLLYVSGAKAKRRPPVLPALPG